MDDPVRAECWDACDDLAALVALSGAPRVRPVHTGRLLVAAALRADWDRAEPPVRAAVEAAERHAEAPDEDGLRAAFEALVAASRSPTYDPIGLFEVEARLTAAQILCDSAERVAKFLPSYKEWAFLVGELTRHPPRPADASRHLALFRCLFPNPFRPVAFDPVWLTEAVAGVAAAVHDRRDFGALPVLADALQDAGCDDADVLGHCRRGGPHAFGCWVVEMVRGSR